MFTLLVPLALSNGTDPTINLSLRKFLSVEVLCWSLSTMASLQTQAAACQILRGLSRSVGALRAELSNPVLSASMFAMVIRAPDNWYWARYPKGREAILLGALQTYANFVGPFSPFRDVSGSSGFRARKGILTYVLLIALCIYI